MTKTEWQIKDDDDDDDDDNDDDDEKGHLNTFLLNREWRTRMGNGNMKNENTTENWKWSYWFSTKPGSLSSPSMTTLHTLFFFYLAQFCFFGSKTSLVKRLLKHGKEKSKSGPCEDLIKRIIHL